MESKTLLDHATMFPAFNARTQNLQVLANQVGSKSGVSVSMFSVKAAASIKKTLDMLASESNTSESGSIDLSSTKYPDLKRVPMSDIGHIKYVSPALQQISEKCLGQVNMVFDPDYNRAPLLEKNMTPK